MVEILNDRHINNFKTTSYVSTILNHFTQFCLCIPSKISSIFFTISEIILRSAILCMQANYLHFDNRLNCCVDSVVISYMLSTSQRINLFYQLWCVWCRNKECTSTCYIVWNLGGGFFLNIFPNNSVIHTNGRKFGKYTKVQLKVNIIHNPNIQRHLPVKTVFYVEVFILFFLRQLM